jgi:sortase A
LETCDTENVQDSMPVSTETRPQRSSVRRRRGRIAWTLRALALVLIGAGLAIGGNLAWQLWGTGFTTQRLQAEMRPNFERVVGTKVPTDPSASAVRVPGNAVAILKIPRIHLNMVVVEGTDTESLKRGPGHYTGTAYPWQDQGRVAIAGHRTTYLHPFYDLNEMQQGDPIILETEYGTFRYVVTRVFVITPDNSSVLDQTKNPTLVLTTCNPRYSAAQRLIVVADRVS